LVYLLNKANRVFRVESLILWKNTLMSWLVDENKIIMVKELRQLLVESVEFVELVVCRVYSVR